MATIFDYIPRDIVINYPEIDLDKIDKLAEKITDRIFEKIKSDGENFDNHREWIQTKLGQEIMHKSLTKLLTKGDISTMMCSQTNELIPPSTPYYMVSGRVVNYNADIHEIVRRISQYEDFEDASAENPDEYYFDETDEAEDMADQIMDGGWYINKNKEFVEF